MDWKEFFKSIPVKLAYSIIGLAFLYWLVGWNLFVKSYCWTIGCIVCPPGHQTGIDLNCATIVSVIFFIITFPIIYFIVFRKRK